MDVCKVCGKDLGYHDRLTAKRNGNCLICSGIEDDVDASRPSIRAEASANQLGSNSSLVRPKKVPESTSLSSNQADNVFTKLTYLIVVMTLVATGVLTFMLASNDQPMLAAVTFMTGCFGAVSLGLLAEISANVIRLVNKSS